MLMVGCLIAGQPALATATDPGKSDSVKVTLGINDLYKQILANHPVARQAYLLSEEARQQLRHARGMFDPKLASSFDRKEFKDAEYYQMWDSQLKVPVWLGGIDLIGGFEQNRGVYLDPEHDTDSGNGLAYGGLSIPIGQGLVIDQRRAVLRQAQIFEEIAEAERVKLLNKLLLQVAKDYWQWYFFHNQYELLEEGYELAEFRFRAVKIQVEQGDLAPIDSTEAKITMQQRMIDLQMAEIQLQNARIMLSNHLWNSEDEPLELPEGIIPARRPDMDLTESTLEELYVFARQNHPELRKVTFKLEQLDIERKLAREMLKPVINLKYNFLAQTVGSGGNNEFNMPFFRNNYKLGVDFSFPIFLRKERAKLALTNIKIDGTNLERVNLNRTVLNQIATTYNETRNMASLITMQEEMVENYQRMVRGEEQMFRNGESSLFYVNVREGKLIEAEVKLYDMRHKYAKLLAELRWAAGMGR